MSLAPYFFRNLSATAATSFELVIGVAVSSAFALSKLTRSDGFFRTFLYHCVSEPLTGNRSTLSPSRTNQTGREIVRPDFLPVTLILISRARERCVFKSSIFADIRTPVFTGRRQFSGSA